MLLDQWGKVLSALLDKELEQANLQEVSNALDQLTLPKEQKKQILEEFVSRFPATQVPAHDPNLDKFISLAHKASDMILFIGPAVLEGAGMPSHKQYSDVFEEEIRNRVKISEPRTWPKVIGAANLIVEREDIQGKLNEKHNEAIEENPLAYQKGFYRFLSELPVLNKLLVATNWDEIAADTLRQSSEGTVREIIYSAQLPPERNSDIHNIIYLHGKISVEGKEPRLFMTDTDYAMAATQITHYTPESLWGWVVANFLTQYHCVFVGYRPEDPEFELLKYAVESASEKNQGESPAHFFVTPIPEAIIKQENSWLNHVSVIQSDPVTFARTAFESLKQMTDREEELERIFSGDQELLFFEFTGHRGSGKTALLDEIQRRARFEGWSPEQILCVDVSKVCDQKAKCFVTDIIQALNNALTPDKPFEKIEEFAAHIKEWDNAFLLFDDTQCAANSEKEEEEFVAFISTVAQAIKDMHSADKKAKLVWAGTYPLKRMPFGVRVQLLSTHLSPLDDTAVEQMIRNFLLIHLPDTVEIDIPQSLSNDIYQISAGHPGFVEAILEDLFPTESNASDSQLIPTSLSDVEKREFVFQFSQEIEDNWGRYEHLKRAYREKLCVFRLLSPGLLDHLKKDLEINPAIKFRDLTQHYIFSPRTFEADPVIRSIKSLALKYISNEEYAKAHELAMKIFDQAVQNATYPRQKDFFIELLFHTACVSLNSYGCDKEADRYREIISKIEFLHEVKDRDFVNDYGPNLVDEIWKDKELRDLLKKCLSDEHFKGLPQILEKRGVTENG